MKHLFSKKQVKDTLYVTIGSFILALSINAILLPNALVAGGANGISVVLNHLFGWNIAVVLYAINIPLLALCFLLLGKEVGIKTIYGSMIYPFFVGITSFIPTMTTNIFLAALFGGVLTGLGLGLEFRGDGSTGGTAIVSQIVNKYLNIPIGICVLFVDGFVILAALFVFNIEIVLYSLICLFVIGRVVDMTQVGPVRFKNLLVISPNYAEMKELLIDKLDKGVTLIPIEGGFHNQNSVMLMTVIKEKDFLKLKEQLLQIDEAAFIVSTNASEVYGKGFSIKRFLDYME